MTLARTDRVTLGCTSAAGPEPEAGCKGQQGGERGQDQKPQQGAAGSQSSRPKPRLHLEEKLRHPPSCHQAQVPVKTQTWVAPCLPWGRGSPTHVQGPSGQRWLQGQAEHLRCLRDGEAAAGTGAVCAGHGAEEGPGMAPSGSGWQPQLQLPGGGKSPAWMGLGNGGEEACHSLLRVPSRPRSWGALRAPFFPGYLLLSGWVLPGGFPSPPVLVLLEPHLCVGTLGFHTAGRGKKEVERKERQEREEENIWRYPWAL